MNNSLKQPLNRGLRRIAYSLSDKANLVSESPMSSFSEGFREQFDFKSHFLEIDGHRLHYLDQGEGEPIVLLHGNPSWSFMYRDLIPILSSTHRVIVPDHIGCGLSEKPGDDRYDYTLYRRVSDFQAFVEELRLGGSFSLVLHDWGGPIGISYAVRNPGRIEKLVLFNTAGFLLPFGKSMHWTLRWCRRSAIAGFMIRGLNFFSVGATRLGTRRKLPKEVRKAYRAPYDSWRNRIAVLRFIQDIPLDPGDPSYRYLEETGEKLHLLRGKPISIFWGERDFIFDLEFLDEWIRRFPDAEIHRFPDGGHYILEDCRDEIAPRLSEFLEKSG